MIKPDARVKVCLKCRFFSLVKFSGFLTCNLIGQYVCVGKLCMMWMTPQLKMKYRPDGKFHSIPSGPTRAPPEAIRSSRHISTGMVIVIVPTGQTGKCGYIESSPGLLQIYYVIVTS